MGVRLYTCNIPLTPCSPGAGFLAAFCDMVVIPSGLSGDRRSISGRLTGTGMQGIEPLTDAREADALLWLWPWLVSIVRGARFFKLTS